MRVDHELSGNARIEGPVRRECLIQRNHFDVDGLGKLDAVAILRADAAIDRQSVAGDETGLA